MARGTCLVHLAVYAAVVVGLSALFLNSDLLWNTPEADRRARAISVAEGSVYSGDWTRARADEFLAKEYWGRQAARVSIVLVGTGLVAFVYLVVRADELLR